MQESQFNPLDLLPILSGRVVETIASIPEVEREAVVFDLDTPIGSWEMENDEWWWALETKRRRDRLEALLSIPGVEEQRRVIRAEIALCKADPVHFVNNYCFMENPTDTREHMRELPAVLFPRQEELIEFLLRRYAEGKPALIIKGRELGVTWIVCFLIYNLFREESKFRAKMGSRKEDLVDGDKDSIFAKFRYVDERLPFFLKPPMRSRYLRLDNVATSGEISGEATNRGFSRGGRRSIIGLDEFAHADDAVAQKIWVSIQRAARSIWVYSTPNGPGNKFAELYEKVLAKDAIFEMDWTADPRRDQAWKAKQLESMTDEEFEQEHGAKIVTMKAGKIWSVRRALVEYDDRDVERETRLVPKLRTLPLVGGWDFGSGASLLVCLFAVVEIVDGKPWIWVEHERVWKQEDWLRAAAEAKTVMGGYPCPRHLHFGDPAGRAPESDQSDWEKNLRRGGIPLFCLPDHVNSRNGQEWGLKHCSALFAEARLRVHRRCTYLWSCIENWRRATPEGLTLDVVSAAYIAPRHDQYSHGGWALVYLIDGVLSSLGAMVGGKSISAEEATKRMNEAKHGKDSFEAPAIGDFAGAHVSRFGRSQSLIAIMPKVPTDSVYSRVMGRGNFGPPGFDD